MTEKKIYLFLVIIISLFLYGCINHSRMDESGIIKHIDLSNVQTFNEIEYRQECFSDNDCTSEYNDYCLKCPGGKFIFSDGGCQLGNKVFAAEQETGLCIHTGNTGLSYESFYNGDCISTPICLLPFNNQEVPTVSTEEASRILPIWKEQLIEKGFAEAYINDHIYVYSADLASVNRPDIFLIKYYFKMDWFIAKWTDGFSIYEISDDLQTLGRPLSDEEVKKSITTHFTRPIAKVLSESEAKIAIKKCSSSMSFNKDNSDRINLQRFQGRLTIEAWDTVDDKANKCKRAVLDLETGELIECADVSCRIY